MTEFFTVNDPINYEEHAYYAVGTGWRAMPEVPHALRLEWAIGTALEWAVAADAAIIQQQTKLLEEGGLLRLGESVLLPTTLTQADAVQGDINRRLQLFADTTYHHVTAHFQQPVTTGWHIVPHFEDGNDMQQTYKISLFIHQDFTQTVVE